MSERRVAWDSASCLAFLKDEEGRADLCENVLQQARTGKLVIVISALVLAETLHLRGAAPIARGKRDDVRKFFLRSAFLVADVTRAIAERAQDLVWDQGVAPKDAVHVATALHYRVPILHTFDGGLHGKSKTLGSAPKLVICAPGEEDPQLNLKVPRSPAEKRVSPVAKRSSRRVAR